MYSLIFSKDARKFIDKQTAQTKQRIRNALLQLAEDPFSNRQVKCLKGTEDILRLRVGDFRVVFSIEEELSGRPKFLILVALDNDEVVGYKIGYQERKARFYSWLGGVYPEYRSQGIASELMLRQHEWCKSQGY